MCQQWCDLLPKPPVQKHTVISIAECVADVWQRAWIWGPKQKYWFWKTGMNFHYLQWETEEINNSKNTFECDFHLCKLFFFKKKKVTLVSIFKPVLWEVCTWDISLSMGIQTWFSSQCSNRCSIIYMATYNCMKCCPTRYPHSWTSIANWIW